MPISRSFFTHVASVRPASANNTICDRLVPTDNPSFQMLIARCGRSSCALHLRSVAEVMRPLPLQTFAGMPPFLLGIAGIRGQAVPVVCLATLLGSADGTATTRFITIQVGSRLVALASTEVVGIRLVSQSDQRSLPPLMSGVHGDIVSALSTLDQEMLLILEPALILTDDQLLQCDYGTLT
jgi:purine-binding chemotaxis protein CheW